MTVVVYVGPPVGGVPWPEALASSLFYSAAGLDALGLQFSRIKKDGTDQHLFDFEKKELGGSVNPIIKGVHLDEKHRKWNWARWMVQTSRLTPLTKHCS